MLFDHYASKVLHIYVTNHLCYRPRIVRRVICGPYMVYRLFIVLYQKITLRTVHGQ